MLASLYTLPCLEGPANNEKCLSVHSSVSRSVYLNMWRYVHLSVCLPVHPSIFPNVSVHLFICLSYFSICLFIYYQLSVYLFICLSICHNICLPSQLSVCLLICLSKDLSRTTRCNQITSLLILNLVTLNCAALVELRCSTNKPMLSIVKKIDVLKWKVFVLQRWLM
jgi:hypothetical protein